MAYDTPRNRRGRGYRGRKRQRGVGQEGETEDKGYKVPLAGAAVVALLVAVALASGRR